MVSILLFIVFEGIKVEKYKNPMREITIVGLRRTYYIYLLEVERSLMT